ncbi:hypothetical protein [Halostagnicola kamekurae]|uniref:Uncharacterized protein n=1 Tax=Halostagnicola kamekurae TaxID=619731 RepID=A0A1I6PYW0_9EURY|nr:hypothetical protein [Halostagnicola kamekurae]SFS45352.1 hypothetical protein SAMN04488556_0874 [Halostagnicola kamekurae]
MNDATAAFLVGAGWTVIVFVYGEVSNTGMIPRYEGTIQSAIRSSFNIAFVGGGTGVVIYVVEHHLSAISYGLAGIVVASVIVLIAAKFR